MPFPFQPTYLGDERVRLLPLQPHDLEPLFRVASDPLLWEQHPNKDRYRREVFEEFFKAALLSGGALLIKDAQTGEVVGSSRYYDYDPQQNSIAIGYTFIGRKYWGTGYNQAVKSLMLAHAFETVARVIFHIGAYNYRSQKAIEKTGAVRIGEFEADYVGEDTKLNYIYQMDKNML